MATQQTFNSFSGVDITPIFNGTAIGEIQAISYSINREKAPVYTMGKADPRSFARGKRGIAGSLIFIVFDRHSLIESFSDSRFLADADSVALKNAIGNDVIGQAAVSETLSTGNDNKKIENPWYADQIPPFDIILEAANEYGAAAKMTIFGVELLNENSGVSIDDIVTEMQYTYIARSVQPWKQGVDQTSLVGNKKG